MANQDILTDHLPREEEEGVALKNLDLSFKDSKPPIVSLDTKQLKQKVFDQFAKVINRSNQISQINLRRNLEKLNYQERKEVDVEMEILQEYYLKEQFRLSGQMISDKERDMCAIKRLYAWGEEDLKSSWLDFDTSGIKDPQIKTELNSLKEQLQNKMLSKQLSISKKFIDLTSEYLEIERKNHASRLEDCDKYLEQCLFKIDYLNTSDIGKVENQINLLLQNFAHLVGVDVTHNNEV